MKKNKEPADWADETGIKMTETRYVCHVCGKVNDMREILKNRWHYRILVKEKDIIRFEGKKMGFVPIDKVRYVCAEDFLSLPEVEAGLYAEAGMPYFIARLDKQGGIFSF